MYGCNSGGMRVEGDIATGGGLKLFHEDLALFG
jgi:hypothetical protein